MNKLPGFAILIAAITITLTFFIVNKAMSDLSQNQAPRNIAAKGTKEACTTPKIREANAHTLIFVGDSMTDYLRTQEEQFRGDLNTYYPGKVFGIFNYGFGATNILSVDERLEKETVYKRRKLSLDP